MRRLDRRRRREGGQSTVELALVLPVVAIVALSLIDIGLVIRDNLLVVHAAREAARAQAVGEDPVTAARARSGLGSALTVSANASTGTVTVELPLTGRLFILNRLAGGATLRQRATMRIEADAAQPP
jgi:Flp pilus assembly protein TadG